MPTPHRSLRATLRPAPQAGKPAGRHSPRFRAGLIGVLLATGTWFSSCPATAQPFRADSVPVPPAALSSASGSGAPTVDLGGEMAAEVTAMRKVALAFKVSGRLEKVSLFAGEVASEGAVIATLDPRDFQLADRQAEAALEIGRLKLKQMEAGARPEERRTAAENLEQARANRDNAQADLVRTRDLHTAGAVSRQALDAAEARAKVSEAQFLAAMQQKAMVDQGPRIEEKETARVAVKQMEAAHQLAHLQMEYAILRAPFAAVVAMRHLDEGAFVSNTTPVYTLVQLDPIFVTVDIPERLVPILKRGMKASITVDALPGRTFTGSVERVPGVIDPKTRTARLELEVFNPGMDLKPGMFARVRLAPAAETR